MGEIMRNLIVAFVVGVTASSSVAFAADEVEHRRKPLVTAALREAGRVAAPSVFRQTPAGQSSTTPETKPWIERHPVWFGLIAGAGVGAAWGALSCSDGCFPIGTSGAALVGSWFGAGPGALLGWAVGRAD
jgi:hypothetical protein